MRGKNQSSAQLWHAIVAEFSPFQKQGAEKMPLWGPITFDPTVTADPPHVECEIVGFFTTPQELEELLAKSSEARASPAPHSRHHSLDPQ